MKEGNNNDKNLHSLRGQRRGSEVQEEEEEGKEKAVRRRREKNARRRAGTVTNRNRKITCGWAAR
jgi:hypothetical protein